MADMTSNASLIGEGGGQSATSNGDNDIDSHLDGVWTCFDFNDAKWAKQLRNFLSNSSSQDTDILICVEGVTIDSIDLVDDQLDKLNIKGRRSFYPTDQTFRVKMVSTQHELICILLIKFLIGGLRFLGALEDYLRSQRTRRTRYADGGLKEPDDCFLPYHAEIATWLKQRRDCPQISVEVALSETLQKLNTDIRMWLVRTRLQTRTAVGIKVDRRRLKLVATVWGFSSEGLFQLHDRLVAGWGNADDIEFLRGCLMVIISEDIRQTDWFLGFSSVTNETGLRTFWENNGRPMQDAEGEDAEGEDAEGEDAQGEDAQGEGGEGEDPQGEGGEDEDDGRNQRATFGVPTELKILHRQFRSLPAPKRRRAIRGTRLRRSWLINAFTQLAEFKMPMVQPQLI
ncbi:hypothetical protein TRICI_001936 [Trichomonascus ciferrii]|uniref:Uncharacterized protein n=1 Tax=Trichomonascus ciferrii TaxID=44093 RepID=A0A642V765_9ASCO|nr:hypothetical protein TRICI_001936 [Trichomonascus ciferrii]